MLHVEKAVRQVCFCIPVSLVVRAHSGQAQRLHQSTANDKDHGGKHVSDTHTAAH